MMEKEILDYQRVQPQPDHGKHSLDKIVYTSPTLLHMIYIPITLLFIFQSYQKYSILTLVCTMLAGLFIWSFIEYVMHRFAFHFKIQHEKIRRFHALFHLKHHHDPQDTRKFQTNIIVSALSASSFYFIFQQLFTLYYDGIFSGFILGYVLYEFTHYSVHKVKVSSRIGKALKQHHMHHHYLNNDKNYGVTSSFWDYIFQTKINLNERMIGLEKKLKTQK